MSSSTSPHLLILSLILSLSLSLFAATAPHPNTNPTFITSPTGVHVPLSLVHSRFSSSAAATTFFSAAAARAVLYDIDPLTHILYFPQPSSSSDSEQSSHTPSVDLRAVTSVVTPQLLTSKGHTHAAIIRTGAGFSVVYTRAGHVLSVSRHGDIDDHDGEGGMESEMGMGMGFGLDRRVLDLDLTPLDAEKYPTVFINLVRPVTKQRQQRMMLVDDRQTSDDAQQRRPRVDVSSMASSPLLTDRATAYMPSSATTTERVTMGAVDSDGVEQPLLASHPDSPGLSLSARHTQSSFDTTTSSSSFSSSSSSTLATSLNPTLRNRKSKPPKNPCHLGTSIRRLRVAIASDLTFCAGHGHNRARALAAIQAKFQLMIQPFLSQTCLYPTLSHVELHCSKSSTDPYARLRLHHRHNASRTLEQFQQLWNANRGNIKRDVAFYYPGYVDATDFSGVAYIGRLCTRKWAYGWAEGLSPLVMAHELGHLLNCDHARDGGIMSPYQYQTAAAVPGLGARGRGYGSQPKNDLTFSTSSLKQLYAYVDTKASSCLARRKQVPVAKRNCVTALTSSSSSSRKSSPQSFSCSRRLAGYVYNKELPLDRVTVYLIQEFDYITVSFVASGGARIRQLATRIGMYKLAFRSDLRGAQTFGGKGRMNVELKLKLNRIVPPYSQNSCCGKDIAIVFSIQFCNDVQKSKCADGFHGFWKQVGCVTCPAGRKLVRQSAQAKCAKCV